MSTPFYRIAHQVLPIKAGSAPTETWNALSGPDWSTWLAMVGQVLGEPVRGVGVEGVLTGKAVTTLEGVELLAIYFPKPTGPGEPFYSVLARNVGSTEVRSFVFELGIAEPGEALRVVMAEWRMNGDNVMRLRYDVAGDASLDTCLRRSVEVMREAGVPKVPLLPMRPRVVADDKSSPAAIVVVTAAIVLLVAISVFLFMK